jgi:hypothetical protein
VADLYVLCTLRYWNDTDYFFNDIRHNKKGLADILGLASVRIGVPFSKNLVPFNSNVKAKDEFYFTSERTFERASPLIFSCR